MTEISNLDDLKKFGSAEPHQQAWAPGRVFSREVKAGSPQINIVANSNQIQLLETLLERMPEPFWLLYVLVVSRGEESEGRYQSSELLDMEQAKAFLHRFKDFFERDGRHNLWFKSDLGPALLVFDRHNLIYGYGLVDDWISTLDELGWVEVHSSQMALPDPHAHHYHAIFDDDARSVLSSMEWHLSPLREQDY